MAPDIGLGALGAALGVVAALLLVLISLAWYPLKRLNRRVRARMPRVAAAQSEARAPGAGTG